MNLINSFDIFDTLLARRCIEPKNIFSELEKTSGLAGLAEARVSAEAKLQHSDYTIDDIYNELLGWNDLTKDQVDTLKNLEISIEIKNAIPILSNINKVNNGDILISDMYLSRNIILSLLRKIGFNKEIGLHVSSHGKSHQTVWNHLKSKINIESHTGDNLHSDVVSPENFGISGILTRNHEINGHEKFFRDNGLETLARIIRELRLSKIDTLDGVENNRIKLNQFQNNIPFLLLSAFHINAITIEKNISNVLFCSRDCFNLKKIYEAIFGNNDSKIIYFYTSRTSRINASSDYLSYALNNLTSNSLVIDLCGTGWSLGQLYEKLNLQPQTLLIHEISEKADLINSYNQIRPYKKPSNLISIISTSSLDNTAIEISNYTDHGMTLDVMKLEEIGHYQPIFEPPKYNPLALKTINLMNDCQNQFFEVLKSYSIDKIIDELKINSHKIPSLMHEIYKDMEKNLQFYSDLLHYHKDQDMKTMRHLKNIV